MDDRQLSKLLEPYEAHIRHLSVAVYNLSAELEEARDEIERLKAGSDSAEGPK